MDKRHDQEMHHWSSTNENLICDKYSIATRIRKAQIKNKNEMPFCIYLICNIYKETITSVGKDLGK